MELTSIGSVIASRELSLSTGKKVTVLIGKPEPYPDGRDFYCPYQILGIGAERVRYAGGLDSAQALILALNKIGADLYASAEAKAGQLSWTTGGDVGDLGFPKP